jgi:hypothetical protein
MFFNNLVSAYSADLCYNEVLVYFEI